MEMESLDYVSTLKKLAEKFGVVLEYDNYFNANNKKSLDKYYEMNEFVAKFYDNIYQKGVLIKNQLIFFLLVMLTRIGNLFIMN